MARLLSKLLLQVSVGLGLLLGLAGTARSQPPTVSQAEESSVTVFHEGEGTWLFAGS